MPYLLTMLVSPFSKEHKILVTPKMQRHLHDVIVWHAGCAEEIFVGGNLHKVGTSCVSHSFDTQALTIFVNFWFEGMVHSFFGNGDCC